MAGIPRYRVEGLNSELKRIEDFSIGTSGELALKADLNGDASENFAANSFYSAAGIICSGNIVAPFLQGFAMGAIFADIAEKYSCDDIYPAGTLVSICDDLMYDVSITVNELDHRYVGVVSEKPAYTMNYDCIGLPITLVGKVPVRVVGEIRKGDFIVPAGNGCARRGVYPDEYSFRIGKSLETDFQKEEKIIECIIRAL